MAKSPRMHYKSWTSAEVRSLKQLARRKLGVTRIAKQLHRTIWAVRNRASREGVSMRAL
jgi:hypothetical protein